MKVAKGSLKSAILVDLTFFSVHGSAPHKGGETPLECSPTKVAVIPPPL